MGQRGVAARLWLPALAALLLVAALASGPGSQNLAPTQIGERPVALGVLPLGEGLVTSTARLSVGEFFRGIERSRSHSFPLALAALGHLLAVLLCWRAWLRPGGSRELSLPLPRVVGARSPPFQLA